MICAWKSFISILPLWMRQDVDRLGKGKLQELRLRLNSPPILIMQDKTISLSRNISAEDMLFCINTASKYSPWTSNTAKNGYITAPGGHRIGLCGRGGASAGVITGIHGVTSLCLRVSRDFPGIASSLSKDNTSVLIIGRPGSGKTTFLRDLIRQKSTSGAICAVVDEREEIFPRVNSEFCFDTGVNTDVLSGCKKSEGIDMVLRSMGPDVIAIDEITAQEDCLALMNALWCGVTLFATAHAGSVEDLLRRSIYRPILESHLFDRIVVLNRDKSWRLERLKKCS